MGIRQATTRAKGEAVNWIWVHGEELFICRVAEALVKFQSHFGLSWL